AGVIQPDTTVEVKSKASGEILEMMVETGAQVKRGDLLVRVDPRIPRNNMAQAQAELDVVRARLANAESQKRRADELYETRSITETEHEAAQLEFANANAAVVQAEVDVENAQIQLEDTEVRSPITGTVIEKSVERGQVITSPASDVAGGTVLMRMADLNLIQVRTLVDETDIGKIRKGLMATITVDAYPNQPFEGEVLKIEPLAETLQNVTMFPVLVRIQNRGGLLRPGMNAEVEIHVGNRQDVLAIPNAALRTPRDVASAAAVLGLDSNVVREELAAEEPVTRRDSLGAGNSGDSAAPAPGRNGEGARARRAAFRSGNPNPRSAGGTNYQFGGRYIVFVKRDGRPVPVHV
ncbi:MAG: efflux RND transporter periplasmic adaptor subunit, partial [Gemmatimonadales bacterium]